MTPLSIVGTFQVPGQVQTGGTAIVAFIPPYTGPQGEARNLFTVDTSLTIPGTTIVGRPGNLKGGSDAGWGQGSVAGAFTHVTDFCSINSSTQHAWVIMRPLNWTYFTAALPKNTTAIPNATLKDDPGLYSTNYRYPTPGGVAPAQVADAAINSTNKYVAYQLADGTWQMDTITSGTFGATLTLTTGTPNRAGGAIPQYSPFFYFGATNLNDPWTGANTVFYPTVSTTEFRSTNMATLFQTFHRGDPMILFNANGTGQDYFSGAFGVYSKDW